MADETITKRVCKIIEWGTSAESIASGEEIVTAHSPEGEAKTFPSRKFRSNEPSLERFFHLEIAFGARGVARRIISRSPYSQWVACALQHYLTYGASGSNSKTGLESRPLRLAESY
jgi:hypothetical protein